MTQKKPEGEKYVLKRLTIPPEHAAIVERWPRGKFSRICQAVIAQAIALDSLPDCLRDDALEEATAAFFEDLALRGDYAIVGQDLARRDATDEDMAIDANWLDIPLDRLLATLQDLFDLELEMQLRKRAILRAARI